MKTVANYIAVTYRFVSWFWGVLWCVVINYVNNFQTLRGHGPWFEVTTLVFIAFLFNVITLKLNIVCNFLEALCYHPARQRRSLGPPAGQYTNCFLMHQLQVFHCTFNVCWNCGKLKRRTVSSSLPRAWPSYSNKGGRYYTRPLLTSPLAIRKLGQQLSSRQHFRRNITY
jgi:hypothetical protein